MEWEEGAVDYRSHHVAVAVVLQSAAIWRGPLGVDQPAVAAQRWPRNWVHFFRK